MGDDSPEAQVCYIACHGYGMNVERFARWFEVLPKGQVALCPEGLSRFYWGGFSGRHAASWMTSDERLHEIEDFVAWLDQVHAEAHSRFPEARIVAFGFSQGAATIMRWLNASRPSLSRLVLWSGTPPEDIDYAPVEYFADTSPVVYWGDDDQLVPWERAAQRFAEVSQVSFRQNMFVGGHRVTSDALMRLALDVASAG